MENNERKIYNETQKRNAKKFMAGQVWYWQDPIFGAKSDENNINLGEGPLRYSRYVLLIQNSDGRRPTIMVAPLTTRSCCSLDVGLYMPCSPYGAIHTHVKVDGVTTVNIHQLKRYICTLTPAQMEMVQEAIWGSLFEDVAVPEDMPSESEFYSTFEEFMLDTEWVEYDAESTEPGATLKYFSYAFMEYCRVRDIRPQGDMFEVARYFKVSTGDDFPMGKYGTIQKNGLVVHIPGVDDLPSSDEEGNEDVDNDTLSEEVAQESIPEDRLKRVSPGLNNWTDARIREFWDYLQNHSIDLTAAKFNICKNSVYKYRKKFADHPAITKPYIADEVEEMVEVRFDDLVNDISACANIIKCCISDQDIFWSPKYGMKKEFYNSISAALYYSLLEYYGIEEDENKNAIIPSFDMNSQFLSEVKWLHEVGEFYRSEKSINWFGRTNRFMKSDMYTSCPLDSEWVDKFALQLERRFGIEVSIEDLVDYVRDRFSK